ncbi:MAG: anti-sigma factor [Oscillospiraceae bacterium]|nr:anti-sigma factor [Oscillospiraceae bacterium]
MADCTEYLELISAYADGELSDNDIRRVEAHLRICDDCSSFLDMLGEISGAVDDSFAEPPKALIDGVMARISGSESPQASAKLKKFKRVNIVLTRVLPAAACLAFLLLTIPRLFASVRKSDVSYSMNTSASERDAIYNENADMGDNASSSTSSNNSSMDADRGASDESMASDNSFDNDSSYGIIDDADLGSGNNNDSPYDIRSEEGPVGGYSSSALDGSPDAVIEAPMLLAPESEPQADGIAVDGSRDEQLISTSVEEQIEEHYEQDRSDASASPSGISPDPNDAVDRPEPVSGVNAEIANAEAGGNGVRDGIYAIITISGDLPAMLAESQPDSVSDDGVSFFELPVSFAKSLIDAISGTDGVVIDIIDDMGTRALVYYTP